MLLKRKRQVSVHRGAAGDGRRGWVYPHLWLGRLLQCAHLTPAFLEEAALFSEGDDFVEAAAWAEMIAEFIMRRAEAGSGVE